jgi:hypothetical protein
MRNFILTDVDETRLNRTETRESNERTETKVLRKIAGKNSRRTRSDNVRLRCNVQPINDKITRRREEWKAHINCVKCNRIL